MVMAQALSLYQWGRENTAAKGTGVAATKKMSVYSMAWESLGTVRRPQIQNGIGLDNAGNELVVSHGTRWTASGPFVFEEFHRWLEMAIVQCVTPTGADPYVWTYTYDPTLNNLLPSYTIERRITEGSNALDTEINYATLESLTVRGSADGEITYEANGFARRIQSSTLTGALSLPTIVIPPFAASKVYIDPAWASLGSTQLTGDNGVLEWEFTIRTGAVPRMSAEARSDLDFAHVVRNLRGAGVDMRIRAMIDTSSGQYATERTAAAAQSLRAVRIQFTGASSRDFTFDALMKHTNAEITMVDEVDGAGVFDLNLVSASDLTNAFKATLTNKTNETP